MSNGKVLLDLVEAENIYKQLEIMHGALKAAGTNIYERRYVTRGMVKLKVAINKAKETDVPDFD